MKAQELVDTARLKSIEYSKDPNTGELVFTTGDVGARRDERGRGLVRTPSSDKKLKSVDKIAQLLEAECERQGITLETARTPFKPGNQSNIEKVRKAKVALVVAGVRGAGATLEAIGKALGMPAQRVNDYENLGRKLREKLPV